MIAPFVPHHLHPRATSPTGQLAPEQLISTVRNVVRRACPQQQSHVDDITQTVVTRLLVRVRRDPEFVLTRRYAVSAAHNAVIDHWRSLRSEADTRRTLAAGPREAARLEDAPLDARCGPVAQWLEVELSRLPEARRRALMLYLTGHRLREIAEHMGWTPKQADNAIFRTLSRLRTSLGEMTAANG